jgi:hypothetical protein
MNDEDFEFGANSNAGRVEECSGTVECRSCNKFHGWCDEVTAKLKGEQMLPTADQPTGRTGRAKTNRLRPEDLNAQPREAKIKMVKADPDGKFGSQVIVKLAVNGEVKFWYISLAKNPNYKILTEKFGHDENDWAGETILLGTEKDEFSDNLFIRVSFPEENKKKK